MVVMLLAPMAAGAILLYSGNRRRKRSKLPTLAHQVDGPYRRLGQRRR